MNKRLYNIVDKIDNIVASEIKIKDAAAFKKENIDRTFEIMKENDILPMLNNQGRRPEQVYFSWMRGYVVSNYFLKALGFIFGVTLQK